jgi:spoIIIJ-associated protein
MDNNEIKILIQELLKKLSVEVEEIEVLRDVPGATVFSVRSRDSKLLIGSRGKHLSAINHIAREIARYKLGDRVKPFTIDVNYYRSQQMQNLIGSAKVAADRAKLFQRDVELEPMSSYERMIVHASLSEDSDIQTESFGEGKFRRVIIKCTPAQDYSLQTEANNN